MKKYTMVQPGYHVDFEIYARSNWEAVKMAEEKIFRLELSGTWIIKSKSFYAIIN